MLQRMQYKQKIFAENGMGQQDFRKIIKNFNNINIMFENLNQIVLMVVPMVFAVTIHEMAHGYAAERMGDPTARLAGRISLNPIRHLDVVGSILLPIILKITGSPILFGYAKPVPINPHYFKDYRFGTIVVSLAGVSANLLIAILSGILFQLIYHFHPLWYGSFFSSVIEEFFYMLRYSVIINLVLMVFNLIPIPPLDGSRVVAMLLPDHLRTQFEQIERFGILILIFLIYMNITGKIISIVVNPLYNLLIGR